MRGSSLVLASVTALAVAGLVRRGSRALALGASARRGSRSYEHLDLATLEPRPRVSGHAPRSVVAHIPAWNSPALRAAFSRVREQRIEAGWPSDHIPTRVPGPEEEARYQQFLREAAYLDNPVRVYRIVSAACVGDVHLGEEWAPKPKYGRGGAGLYWSWDVKRADSYNAGSLQPEYLIVADAPATSVDWGLTVQANVEWPEREVTLHPWASIDVLRVRDVRTGTIVRQGLIRGRA